jgi:hypothetical protein
MRTFLKSQLKTIRIVKVIVASLLAVMILIDVVLVMLEKKNFPTFSWVIRDNRPSLIWFTFLFGGLVAKVFYNRKVRVKESEVTGFLAFTSIVALLFVLGRLIETTDSWHQLFILVCGGILAYRVWPQYID